MSSFKKYLQLTRHEAGFVAVVVFLFSALMFSVGMWVGFGVGTSKVAQVAAHPHGGEATHGHAEAGEEHGRAPASTEEGAEHGEAAAHAVEETGGSELRQAFVDSKQRALTEVMMKDPVASQPQSVVDTQAHFESLKDGGDRKPASVQESAAVAEVVKTKEPKKGKEPARAVRGLFERNPASLGTYEPKPDSFTIQVASFPTEDEAKARMKNLMDEGFSDAYFARIAFKNGESWYRVSVGSYPNPVEARKVGEKIVRKGASKDFVIRQVK